MANGSTHGHSTRVGGRSLVLAGSMLLGTTGTAQAFAPPDASPFAVGAIRMLIGGFLLVVIALTRRELTRGPGWPLTPVLAAAVGNTLFQIGFFNGVRITGVAVTSLVALGSVPIVAGVLSRLVRGERLTMRWVVMTLVALVGVSFLVLGGDVRANAFGIALAALAGTGAATYMLSAKVLLDAHPPTAVAAVTFGLSGVMLAPFLLLTDVSWLSSPRGIAIALHLGVVATAIAFLALTTGLKVVSLATAATLTLAEPLTATALGFLVLGERVAPLGAIGIVLLVSSLLALTVGPRVVEDAPGPDEPAPDPSSPHQPALVPDPNETWP